MSTQRHHLNKFGTFVVLDYPMLYTKFQGYRPLGSEDFQSFLPYMGLSFFLLILHRPLVRITWPGSHLGHVRRNIWTNHPNISWALHMKSGFKRPSVFIGKEVWKCWIWVTLGKGQWMTLILGCLKSSCTHLFDYMYHLSPHRLQ